MTSCALGSVALGSLAAWAPSAHVMKTNKGANTVSLSRELISLKQRPNTALREPVHRDWVELTGRFRIHNMGDIEVTQGVALGSLGVRMLGDRLFEIASLDPEHPLTEHKAKGVAEALRRYDMFDDVQVEPREEEDDFEDEES